MQLFRDLVEHFDAARLEHVPKVAQLVGVGFEIGERCEDFAGRDEAALFDLCDNRRHVVVFCRDCFDLLNVCGLLFNLVGVDDVISSRVGIPSERGDPLGQMKLSSRAKAQAVKKDATALLTACGLALRSFD